METKMATSTVTFFSRTTAGQVKTWSCWIEKDGITVSSRWGIKGGKMQTTSDRVKPTTRKTSKQMAIEEFKRQVEKKLRAGYVEAEERTQAVQLERLKSGLDFDRLPRTFAPAKPIREIAPETAAQWDKAGLLAIQRKRDGMRHYLVAGTAKDGQVRVYSRGMDDMSAHFSRLTQELSLPAGTVLDAEFVVTTPKGADDFTAVSEICRSKPERAGRTLVSYEHKGCTVQFVVFDMLFYDRLPTWQLPYEQRYEAMVKALEQAHSQGRTHFYHVIPMPLMQRSLTDCIARVHARGWEGLILWRKDQATQVHMNRSPKRCNCYKFKPMREGDFVAIGFELGKGRNDEVVGALNLALYTQRRPGVGMKFVSMGNVGTGFSDQQRMEALRWKYPCVVEVKYEKRTKSGLRFPSFLRKRDDKKPKECTA
jgi:bifunctional non-homologous end joining protein LigD